MNTEPKTMETPDNAAEVGIESTALFSPTDFKTWWKSEAHRYNLMMGETVFQFAERMAKMAYGQQVGQHCLVRKLREMRDVQGSNGNWNYDPYMHGMYNGMEYALAMMEEREPEFKDAPDEWLSDRPSPEPAEDSIANADCGGTGEAS